MHGRPMTSEQRQARQAAVIDAAKSFAGGESDLQPLNPAWDHRFLEIIDGGPAGRIRSVVELIRGPRRRRLRTRNQDVGRGFRGAGNAGPYETTVRYYKPAAELIAGFAIRTAVPK